MGTLVALQYGVPLVMNPLVLLAIPLLGALGIAAAGKYENLRESITIITAVVLFGTVLRYFLPVAQLGISETMEVLEVVPGMHLAFHVEPLGMIYALIASGLWILNSFYSIGYMRGNGEKNQTRFYVCFAVSIASVMGIAFSANMLTLFIFYEALSLATFPLVTHAGNEESVRSGRIYLGILVGTSVGLMLPAMIATYVYTGSLDFQHGGVFREAVTSGDMPVALFAAVFVMFMYGIGKAALMPMHKWLPAAMVAPTPVSALLHAVAVVKAGVFTVAKVGVYLVGVDVLRDFEVGGWLVYVAGGTIVIASFIAMFQDNLKRRLAYSTISQLSYITLGVALLWPVSAMAAALHIAAHAFGKITLFFAAGSIYTASKGKDRKAHPKKYVSQLDGIGHLMPWTMAAFTIGSLSMIGLPPTAGFISKWYLLQGAWQADQWFAVGVLVLSTLLNACYFLPIVYRAYFKPPPPPDPDPTGFQPHGEAPLPIVFALTCTAACAVIMFFYPQVFHGLASSVAEGMPR